MIGRQRTLSPERSRGVARYRLTPRALSDLDAIAVFSLDDWGPKQTQTYLDQVAKRFQWLAENPTIGRMRDDVAEGYRSFPEGKHVIYYLIMDDEIAIIGVPHGAMDVSLHDLS